MPSLHIYTRWEVVVQQMVNTAMSLDGMSLYNSTDTVAEKVAYSTERPVAAGEVML